MEKIIKYYLILLIVLNFMPVYAQSRQPDSSVTNTQEAVTDSTLEMPRFQLHINPYLMEKKFFLGEKDYYLPGMQPDLYTGGQEFDTQEKSLEELKAELNVYIQMKRDLMPDYNLGKFGTYMSYGTGIAAVILAIMSVSKHGF